MRRRNRPKLCRECHATATHVEVEQRPAVTVRLDGTVKHSTDVVSAYWCDRHTGMAS